ncbi:MAG: LptE family protein [Bacteroidales bacterium]|nr:LptE family protein [Bacteroidales bacterium]MDD3663931.1 LptE family protein [Bacteroidales bacterium]
MIKNGLLVVVLALVATGCSLNYSFTGASIPLDAKTISIGYFPNEAPLVNPNLSSSLTDALRDRFSSQTRLDLVNSNGDLAIEGRITGYTIQPTAIQGNDVAAQNRLTITVKVTFTNKFDESQNFDETFSRFEDYSSSQDINSVQDDLVSRINEALVDDIFNKSVVNW